MLLNLRCFSRRLLTELHTYSQLLLVIVTISTPLARRTVNENFFVFVCICGYALRARSGLSVCAKPDSNVKHLPIEGLLLRATGNRGDKAPVGRVAPCLTYMQ
jgi:hypothetical protein